jgi:VanZ family protein
LPSIRGHEIDQQMTRVQWTGWLAVGWAILIFSLSSVPAREMPDLPVLQHDKFLHAVLYMPLGALCFLALRAWGKASAAVLVVATALLAGVYGMSDEFHQRFVPGRSVDRYDVLADLVGGTIGALLALIFVWIRRSSGGSRAGH